MKNHFICADENFCELYHCISAPYIRKSFLLPAFSEAKLKVCGLGFYELFVNGQKITKGKLAPYISNPNHLIYYDEYDISPYLKIGKNALGFILGNGFLNNIGGSPWGFDKADFRRPPLLSLVLTVDGKEFFYSDETFKTSPSPIYFNDLRCGEYYDAQKEQEGWSSDSFDDSLWSFAKKAEAPKGVLKKSTAEPVTVQKIIKPVSIKKADGGLLVDFGVNTAGICRMQIQGRKGQKIILRHGEAILEGNSIYLKNTCDPYFDRNISQTDIFICSGKHDFFEPHFTYHGFRYVFVEGGHSWQANDFSIELLQLSSDLKKTGSFSSSNETVNKLQKITVNSDISNFFYFPTDCPQREKNGWTADAALSCEQMLYNLDCSNSLSVWLENIRYAQKENGQLPGIVPTVDFGYEWGNGPAWDMVLTELPYQIYRFTGDKKVLEDNALAIDRYISFLTAKVNENGLVAFGLPDWCECGKATEGEASTPLEVTDTLVSIEICQKAEKIFKIIGKDECAERASNFANRLKNAFRKTWVRNGHFVNCHTQTAQAKAIDVGIFSENAKKKAIKHLVDMIERNGKRFQVGVIGARVLFRVLADNGYGNLSLEMMTKEGFPSYKYWLDNGATSLWEGFNELQENGLFRKDGERVLSLNHHFWGDISAWFYRYILGIHINPNFTNPHEFEIDPVDLEMLEDCKGSYVRNGNGIEIQRKKVADKIQLKIHTVGNTTFYLSEKCRNKIVLLSD